MSSSETLSYRYALGVPLLESNRRSRRRGYDQLPLKVPDDAVASAPATASDSATASDLGLGLDLDLVTWLVSALGDCG